MSNQRSSIPLKAISSSQCSMTNSGVQGDYSANSGSHNIMNVGNRNYYIHPDTNSSRNYDEILRYLYTSEYESHRNRVREPVEGTCTWVTEHAKYKDWLGKRSPGPLWLSADPGCGKSVIASFLVTHLEAQTDAIVCYFFFKDDNEEQRSVTFALCAILHQLFVQEKELCRFAAEEFRAKGKRFTKEVDTLWKILVKAAAEAGRGGVICVLDALDECEEVTLAQLIRHVAHLTDPRTSGTPLKFVFTSRPYHRIEKELDSRAATIRLRGEDEVNSTTADVTIVINNGIRELELVWGNPGQLEYLRNLLESSADRTFLWVSLVLEILKDSEDGSREEFTDIVSTAPRDLAEFYTKILDKSTDHNKARRILHIVVAAARPLTLQEMNVAFRISSDRKPIEDLKHAPATKKTIKNLCGLFVRIIDSRVYLVHQTAREFLIKGTLSGQGKWQYTLSTVDSNFILADICISYLSLEDFESDQLAVHALDLTGTARRARVHNYVKKYALLDYAASHWAGHFRDSGDRQMGLFESTRPICELGSNRFLTWLYVYWRDSDWYFPFPNDFTHLMIATWLGQRWVVKRLLGEGRDINALSKQYGTALNIVALRRDEGITGMLLESGVNAYIGEREYNIAHTKRSVLEMLLREEREARERAQLEARERAQERAQERAKADAGDRALRAQRRRAQNSAQERRWEQTQRLRERRQVREREDREREEQEQERAFDVRERETMAVDFLINFCVAETPDPGTPDTDTADQGTTDQGTADQVAAGQGATDQGTADQVAAGQGATDQGTADQIPADQGATDQGTADQGATDQGAADQAECNCSCCLC